MDSRMAAEGAGAPKCGFVEPTEEHRERGRGANDAPLAWDFGSVRPVTPLAAPFAQPQVPRPSHSPGARGSAPRRQRPGTVGTPPGTRSTSLLRAVRTGSTSLTGLLRRPGTDGESALSAGAAAAPVFELRGAALLPPEPARPATTAATASPSTRTGPALHQYSQQKPAPPSFTVHARVGYRAPTARHQQQQQQQQHPVVVAAHGLASGTSPPLVAVAAPSSSGALSLAQQLQIKAGAAAAAAAVGNAPAPAAASGSAVTQQQQQQQQPPMQQTYSVPSALALQRSRSQAGGVLVQTGAQGSTTHIHQNPLYTAGSEASSSSRPPSAAPPQQQQQQPRMPPPVRVAPASGGSAPPTPLAGASLASSGASPHAATLQAASNLTITSDSRPISPGPLPSILTSCVPADGRPISPQCMDSTPPTPGSHAPTAAAAAAARGAVLSPIRSAVSSAVMQSRSLPASPSPAAVALGSSPAAASPAGPGAPAAAAAAAAFRLPIFNQDGRLVGYKQNSNLIPRPGACISSAPSSPSRALVHSTDVFQASPALSQDIAATAAKSATSASAAAGSTSTSASSDFDEYAAQPCKGFSDPDNMVPGYVLGPLLGKGGFCSVRKALHELTGQAVACKIIEKGKLKDPKDRDRVDRECRVMRNLSNHVAVVRLYEYVETRDNVYIMMEAAARGSLLDYVRDRKKLPEDEAVQILQQLLHALQFCHRKDVVHRDIKLENILIDGAGRMKLIDFGLCGYYVAGKRLRCHCGSPSYAAPEIVARKDYLGPPVDVWSLGIVLFAMLAGYLPFHAKEKKQLSEKILAGVYKPAAWMSPSAQDLISRMLTLDPDQRITLEQVWAHPWVASAPRWEPPGVGAGRVYRALTDPASGAVLPVETVLDCLDALGADVPAIRRALRFRECNSLTASYHLLFEARVEAQRATAAAAAAQEREAVVAAVAATAALNASADWQWDFAAISAAAAAPSSGGGGTSGSAALSFRGSGIGSSGLRGSGSPVRPRTAGPFGGTSSPTRFSQEHLRDAAAAGYLSPRRPPTASAAGPLTWSPFSATRPLHQQQQQPHEVVATVAPTAGAAAAVPSRHRQADAAFVIKALHPAGSGGVEIERMVALQAAVAPVGRRISHEQPPYELAAAPAPVLVPAVVAAAATVVATAEAPSPTCKSPCLSPLPTVLSPKQLQLVPSSGGGEPQPVPQLVA